MQLIYTHSYTHNIYRLILTRIFTHVNSGKKFFFERTVHTVHLSFFFFNFSVITGEYTVKGEQWIVHLRGVSG
ncbi:hypothetical protein DFX92_07745 [Escherichia coli]|nr:hypothetical protein [Escherichia coli]EFB1481799.1 hypothetical protein [Escherichia coli]EFC6876035.1 hypothetical protein [Escherichia coli]